MVGQIYARLMHPLYSLIFLKNTRFLSELLSYDSVLGKRVLSYGEVREHTDYIYMNAFIVPMENYIFLER